MMKGTFREQLAAGEEYGRLGPLGYVMNALENVWNVHN